MELKCLTCGADNPATNLYCGQRGANLHRAAVDVPEHGHPPGEGETAADARAKEEAEHKKRTESARWKEIELESLGIFMPWNLKEPASDPARYAAHGAAHDVARDAASGRSTVEAPPEPRAMQPPVWDIPPVEKRAAAQNIVPTSIPSAPRPAEPAVRSAPRLAEPAVAQQSKQQSNRKRARESHSGRNLTLAVVGAAAILVAFEWRFIRASIVPYVENEVQKVSRQDVPPVTPPAAAAENANPPNANPPVKEPTAANRRVGRNGPVVPSTRGGDSPAPGAAEMYQAAHASDAHLRAAWLWRAVRAENPQASVELAKMYEDGDGVAQSCDQARLLLRAATAKGNAQAKLELQRLPLNGGCPAE